MISFVHRKLATDGILITDERTMHTIGDVHSASAFGVVAMTARNRTDD